MKTKRLLYIIFSFIGINISTAQVMSTEWVKSLGGSYLDGAGSVIVDQEGNSYISGHFKWEADLLDGEEEEIYSGESSEAFIQKYNAEGELQWTNIYGGDFNQSVRVLNINSNNELIVGGSFSGTVDLDATDGELLYTSVGFANFYIMKLNTDGETQWVYTVEEESNGIDNLVIDSSNDIYAIYDMGKIIKLDDAGVFQWSQSYDFASEIYGVDIDETGNIYTIGSYEGDYSFTVGEQEFSLDSGDTGAIYILKLDNTGEMIWAKHFHQTEAGFSDIGLGNVVKCIPGGGIYVGGRFTGTYDFDTGEALESATAIGSIGAFFAQLDDNGNLNWVKTFGGDGYETDVNAMILDDDGNVYLTGVFNGTGDLDPGAEVQTVTTEEGDILIQKYNAEGDMLSAYLCGGEGNEQAAGIAKFNDTIYLVGVYEDIVDFQLGNGDTHIRESAGENDGFFMKVEECMITDIDFQEIELADLEADCILETWMEAPMGMTNCGTSITATTDLEFPITDMGTTVMEWVYTLPNGTTITQNQNIIIDEADFDTELSQDGYLLTAPGPNSMYGYQWLDCDNGMTAISGEDAQEFLPTENGNYAVEISYGGCTEISDCKSITGLSMDELENPTVKVYANLTDHLLYAEGRDITKIVIMNINGVVMDVYENSSGKPLMGIQTSIWPKGLYIVELHVEDTIQYQKVLL